MSSSPTSAIKASPSDPSDFRPGITLKSAADEDKLGPLADLEGTWIGTGYNLIALPDYTRGHTFRLRLNTTVEILEFEQIGANVPNRGSFSGEFDPQGQDDIDIYGLRYLQRIADGKNQQPLHIEPGFWLHVPQTEWPEFPKSVVREAVIPHGNSLLAVGEYGKSESEDESDNVRNSIPEICSFPTRQSGDSVDDAYLKPFTQPFEDFDVDLIKNPNLALTRTIDNQKQNSKVITKTVRLHVSAKNAKESNAHPDGRNGGIANIPFIVKNANVKEFDSTFWIETVEDRVLNKEGKEGRKFLQLQYTQTVVLDYFQMDWPHISVATLIKQ